MKIHQYIAKYGHGTIKRLALDARVSAPQLSRLVAGDRGCSPELAARLEKATHGEVMRWDLRRDWREIWPELEGHPSAPRRPGRKTAHG